MKKVEVRLATDEVVRDGLALKLGPALSRAIRLLALYREGVTKAHLLKHLWPRAVSQNGTAYRVLLYRMRKALGANSLRIEGERITMTSWVRIDLWDVEDAASAKRLPRAELRSSIAVWQRLHALRLGSPPDGLADRRFSRTCERTGLALARAALHSGVPSLGLELAHSLLDCDPLNESAREIAIRALLASNDRAGAIRELRQYQEAAYERQCVQSASRLFTLLCSQINAGSSCPP